MLSCNNLPPRPPLSSLLLTRFRLASTTLPCSTLLAHTRDTYTTCSSSLPGLYAYKYRRANIRTNDDDVDNDDDENGDQLRRKRTTHVVLVTVQSFTFNPKTTAIPRGLPPRFIRFVKHKKKKWKFRIISSEKFSSLTMKNSTNTYDQTARNIFNR